MHHITVREISIIQSNIDIDRIEIYRCGNKSIEFNSIGYQLVSPMRDLTDLFESDSISNDFQILPEWLNEENPSLERLLADHNRLNVLPDK